MASKLGSGMLLEVCHKKSSLKYTNLVKGAPRCSFIFVRISSYQHLRAQISHNGNHTIGSHTVEHQVLLSVPSGRSGETIEGTRCLCTKSADPILSVRICVERELAAFASCAGFCRLLWLSRAICAAVELRVYIICYLKMLP